MPILIQDVLHIDRQVDILIEGNRITKVENAGSINPASLSGEVDIISGKNRGVIPGLVNCHTHAAMTYFRGYGDDRDLMDWLENMIWPVEAHLTPDDIYWGSRLACMEMIQTGTTAFLDMYTFPEATAQAVEDSGIRAVLSYTMFDRWDDARAKLDQKNCHKYFELFSHYSDRVRFAVGPHAIYTVSAPQLQFAHEFAKEHDCLVNLHLAETYQEWKDCTKNFGTTPVRYLKDLGVLSPRLVLAHSLWMDSEELQILADYGCSTVHNPASNMKLASGYKFRSEEMCEKGIRVGIGTDGCSSSNNLDMVQAMKLASLLGKAWRGDPKATPAKEMFVAATKAGSEILRIDGGEIELEKLADLSLVRLDIPEMTPCHDFISNLVYSASGSAVDTTIVDGKVLMRERQIPEYDVLLKKGVEVSNDLLRRAGRG